MTQQYKGIVEVARNDGTVTIYLNGDNGNITMGGNGADGDIILRTSDGKNTLHLNGDKGNITLGGNGEDGDIYLKDGTGNTRIQFDAQQNLITVKDGADNTIVSIGANGNITLGGQGQDGDILLNDNTGQQTVHLNGQEGNISLGGNGHDGDVFIYDAAGKETIHLNGDSGDIMLHNADCAEDFDVMEVADAEPGTVMVIENEGKLVPGNKAYDKRVAGIVSGAGAYQPGIVLDKQKGATNRKPIALMGKVYCKVDAGYAPVAIGDLLTTSPTAGHAMKASSPNEAFGAVIGKALGPLDDGTGMIPVLVSLQ